MRLQRLTLQGFKSFATKTEFVFPSGLVAIVGPNGAGKSNLGEAIRWALGETAYSNLRAKRTEDVIFAGGESRAQSGLAQVSLHFDNADRWLDTDFSEVVITRRAHRDGSNEYLLNGSRVRLKDIHELLAKTGLGPGAQVVIGQGLVDSTLSLRAEERRGLFEEAAGIAFYRMRREEALSRLAKTSDNLLRLQDILSEIRPRLRSLERQHRRLADREKLAARLQGLLAQWYGQQWRQTAAELEARRASRAQVGAALEALRSSQQATSARLASVREALSALEAETRRSGERREGLAHEVAVGEERLRQLGSRHDELAEEVERLEERLSDLEAELASLAQRREALGTPLRQVEARLQEFEAGRRTWEQIVEGRRQEATRARRSVLEEEARLGGLEGRLRAAQAELIDLPQAVLAAGVPLKLESGVSALQGQLAEVEAEGAEMEASLKRTHDALQGALGAERDLAAQLETAQQEWQRRKQAVEARLPFDGEAERLRGLIGPVADLFEVPPGLELAVAAALESQAPHLAVESWSDAQAVIDSLARSHGRRATVWPLNAIRGHDPATLSAKGALGRASDLVGSEGRYRPLLSILLGRVLIVEDLSSGRDLLQRLNGHAVTCVTVEGQVLLDTGAVRGGSPERLQAAFNGGYREAMSALARSTGRVEALRRELAAARASARELADRLDGLHRARGSLEGRLARVRALLAREESGLARAREEARWAERQAAEALARRQRLEAQIGPLSRAVAAAQEGLVEARQALQKAEEALAAEESRGQGLPAELQAKAAEIRVEAAGLEELERRLRSETAQVDSRLDQGRQRLIERESEGEALRQSLAGWQAELTEVSARRDEAGARETPLRRELEALQAQTHEAQEVSQAERALNEATFERRRLEDRLQHLTVELQRDWEAYDLPLDHTRQLALDGLGSAPEPIATDQLEDELRSVKTSLRSIGSVDAETAREFGAVKERHDHLAAGVEDLQKASTDLQAVISELDGTMRQRFDQTLDQVNHQFGHFFTRLFGGGEASLELSQEGEWHQAGVEIIARPPGKRRQALASLSGGERALTSVALIFALLRTNPLPFTVLDEVDAMLDEANVSRFRETLLELAEGVQFIIVTHNRTTIEAANTLYGVTMGDDGVSRVLSLQLDEALAQATP